MITGIKPVSRQQRGAWLMGGKGGLAGSYFFMNPGAEEAYSKYSMYCVVPQFCTASESCPHLTDRKHRLPKTADRITNGERNREI